MTILQLQIMVYFNDAKNVCVFQQQFENTRTFNDRVFLSIFFSENRNEEIEEGNKWNRAKIVKKVSFTIQTRNLNITRIYAQRHMHSLVVIYNARTQRIQKV